MKSKWQLLCTGGLWAIASLGGAQAAPVLSQNFDAVAIDSTVGTTPPAGWTVRTYYSDGSESPVAVTEGSATWLGWKFLNKSTWTAQKTTNASTKRGDFTLGSNGIALIESDGLRAAKVYSATLETPAVNVAAGKKYQLSFNTHYRQGQAPQTADVIVSFDKGSAQTFALTADTLNQAFQKTLTVPADATTAKISWNYRSTANNWYWAVDDVLLDVDTSAPPTPFDPAKLPDTAAKPTLSVGPTLQNPGPDRMAVMLETTEPAPTVWLRKAGSTGPYTLVPAINPAGDFADNSIFFADLKGLQSNTLYEYAMVTGTSAAPKLAGPFQFKTWPKEGDNVASAKFAVVSDTQDGLANRFKNITQSVINNDCAGVATQCAETVAGFMVPGDLVNSGGTRSQWASQFFGPLSAISAYVPLIPAPGNHEYFANEQASEGAEKSWAKTYRKYFNRMPANGSTKHPLHWYSLDYLGMRIVGSDFNPASAMHNTGGWNSYDNGRGLFRADYMREHLDWFTGLMQQTRQDKKPYMVLLNHHPCLSEKWRQGEVMAACDFISQMEDYGRSTGAITVNLNGHVHFYERGNSMDSRHLWLNVASGSGNLESAKQEDDSDLDVIANTKLTFGYGTLEARFGGAAPALAWKRYDLGASATSTTPDDTISVTSEKWAAAPKLTQAKLGKVDAASVQLAYNAAGVPGVYEAQWQLSKDAKFGKAQPVYDVWGNNTRRENWSYINGVRTNTQNGVDISTLALGQLLANPKRVYPNVGAATPRAKVMTAVVAGGNSLLDRWSCAYKWDDNGDTGPDRQGGRQCFARLSQDDGSKGSAFDPFGGKAPEVLKLGTDERWYWRVRVRDEHLNWSDWSAAGSFELGNPAPEPEPPVKDLINVQLPGSAGGQPAIGLQVQASATCQSTQSSTAAVPAGLLPRNLQAATGLVSFTIADCNQQGFSAQVKLTLPKELPANSRVMKVSTGADGKPVATDITGQASISGNAVSYTITDGGALDEDGKTNGAILDPVLVATPAAVDPDPNPGTDQPTPVPVGHPVALLLASALLAGAAGWRQRRKR